MLSGLFPDQAALHGFLHRLRSLGLDVVEVRQVSGVEPGDQPAVPSSAEQDGDDVTHGG